MLTVHRRLPLLFAFAGILFFSAPLVAQDWRGGAPYAAEAQQRAYDNGFHEGQERGKDDARHDRVFDYTRDKEYRKADEGYKDRYGSREWYRNEFRRGYVAGYTQTYNQWSPRGRRYDNRDYGYTYPAPRDEGRAVPRPYSPYGDGVRMRAGYDKGYNDGFDKGRDDARHDRRADPYRQGWYRDGDRGYHREYGPKDAYIASYRDGFLSGYAAAYGNGGYYR